MQVFTKLFVLFSQQRYFIFYLLYLIVHLCLLHFFRSVLLSRSYQLTLFHQLIYLEQQTILRIVLETEVDAHYVCRIFCAIL